LTVRHSAKSREELGKAVVFDKITPLPEGGPLRPVLLRNDFAVPQRFVASGETISIEVEIDNPGDPRIRRLEVRDTDGAGITSAALRKLAIGRLTREAVAAAARPYTPSEDGAEPVFRIVSADPREAASFYRQYTRDARRPRRGSPLTDDDLRQVADIYRAAMSRGDPPTLMVADQLYAARSTAARWVATARKRGFLGPALRGRAGEL
jgi:hypothetical protein